MCRPTARPKGIQGTASHSLFRKGSVVSVRVNAARNERVCREYVDGLD